MARQILGESPPIKALLALIKKVSQTKANVLVMGESGTGKELVARMIHDHGPLRDKAFIPVNCGAIPETLIESEMFGHKRGSFTGAIQDKMGLFEAAHGGTLFLDEVGELPLPIQVKLLRAIQEKAFRKVGSTEDLRVDVRVIAATNRDLEEAVSKGTFREDLFYRLNVIQIRTPPLRERKSDIRLLAKHFLSQFSDRAGKKIDDFEPPAWLALEQHPWPGNVRELENVVERAVTLETGKKITQSSFPSGLASPADAPKLSRRKTDSDKVLSVPAPDFSKGPVDLDAILGSVEKVYLMNALQASGGVKKRAADLLGITFRSIRYRLKKLGVKAAPSEES